MNASGAKRYHLLATGTTQWPDSFHAADDYAAELLAIAEARLSEGPPPASLPLIPWRARHDPATRVGGTDEALPALDEPELVQLEQVIARQSGSPRGIP